MTLSKTMVSIFLVLLASVGLRYFFTGTYHPDLTYVFAPLSEQTPNTELDTTFQNAFTQPVMMKKISPTIVQISKSDIDQDSVWSIINDGLNITTRKLHKLSILKGDVPNTYKVEFVFTQKATK